MKHVFDYKFLDKTSVIVTVTGIQTPGSFTSLLPIRPRYLPSKTWHDFMIFSVPYYQCMQKC